MGDFYTKQDEAVTHISIVHDLLKKIVVEISTKEFRGGYKKPVVSGGVTYMDYIPDSRAEYIQSIESLADVLLPQYDSIMEKNYHEYVQGVEEIDFGLEGKDIMMGDNVHSQSIRDKLRLVKRLFRDLNLLLKRTRYLKKAAYQEGEVEEGDEEE